MKEQSIEQFHRKSLEIQELLQSKEAPLELQVFHPSKVFRILFLLEVLRCLFLAPINSVSHTCPQVIETALKKKMEQVKEIFDNHTEAFQELLSVRAHLLQRIEACQTAIQRIHSSVRMLCAENKALLQQHLQVLL